MSRDFIEALRDSHAYVNRYAEWLRDKRGYSVTIKPNKERPERSEWKSFVDECDLEMHQPIEVKSTSRVESWPNGADDWPFPNVNVMAVHAWESKSPKPHHVAIISNDMKYAAIIMADTFKYWTKSISEDGTRGGESQEVYRCPKDKCIWLKL